MQLEMFQQAAVQWLCSHKRGSVIAPAGSGKTIIAAAALAGVLNSRQRDRKVKIGWLAMTIEQVTQAKTALENFSEIIDGADVVVACAAAMLDWSDCDVLVVDEAHHAATAATWEQQVETCRGARWAFTATPPADREAKEQFARLFGPDVYTVARTEVASRITGAKVIVLNDTDPGLEQPITKEIKDQIQKQKARYGRWLERQNTRIVVRSVLKEAGISGPEDLQAIISHGLHESFRKKMDEYVTAILHTRIAWNVCIRMGIVGNAARNRAAIDRAKTHVASGDSVIVLVNQIEHGKQIAAEIPGAVACHSSMKARKPTLEKFKAGEIPCIVATSLADEGLDVPRANVLVLVSGGRSKARTEQRTGRVLRVFAGKEHGLIYDFSDRQHPMMERHAGARRSLYRKLGYAIEDSQQVPNAQACMQVSPTANP